jgi:hypothetical protein
MTHDLLPPPSGIYFAILTIDQIGQYDGPICGVGTTPDAAWKDAREWVDVDDLHWFDEDADRDGCPYACLPCDESVATMVEAEGGQMLFEVRRGRIWLWDEEA